MLWINASNRCFKGRGFDQVRRMQLLHRRQLAALLGWSGAEAEGCLKRHRLFFTGGSAPRLFRQFDAELAEYHAL